MEGQKDRQTLFHRTLLATVGILIFTMLYLLKQIKKENSWKYHYLTPVYQKSWWYDIQFLRYKAWQTQIGHLLTFYPPKNEKSETWILWEISSIYTCVQKITIIWCMVPDIQSETDRIFCHFRPFFCPFTTHLPP